MTHALKVFRTTIPHILASAAPHRCGHVTHHTWVINHRRVHVRCLRVGEGENSEEMERMIRNLLNGGPYLFLENKRGYHCCNQETFSSCAAPRTTKDYRYGVGDDIAPLRSALRIPKRYHDGDFNEKIKIRDETKLPGKRHPGIGLVVACPGTIARETKERGLPGSRYQSQSDRRNARGRKVAEVKSRIREVEV